MARNEDSAGIIKAIRAILSENLHADTQRDRMRALRVQYPDTSTSTWYYLVDQARQSAAAEPVQPAMRKVTEASTAIAELQVPASADPRKRGRGRPAKAAVMSFFGGSGGMTTRHSVPRPLLVLTPRDIAHQLSECIHDGVALQESAADAVTGGHIIRDPATYSAGGQIKVAALMAYGRLYEKIFGLQRVEDLANVLTAMVKQTLNPEAARQLNMKIGGILATYQPEEECRPLTILVAPSARGAKRGPKPKAKRAP